MRWPTGTLLLHGLAGKVKYASCFATERASKPIQAQAFSNENLNPRVPPDAHGLRLMSAPENMRSR